MASIINSAPAPPPRRRRRRMLGSSKIRRLLLLVVVAATTIVIALMAFWMLFMNHEFMNGIVLVNTESILDDMNMNMNSTVVVVLANTTNTSTSMPTTTTTTTMTTGSSKSKSRDFPNISSVNDASVPLPSATIVEGLLKEERNNITTTTTTSTNTNSDSDEYLHRLANTYALTYAFIHEFQRRDIPIILYAGSHLGANRHHGIIPFDEKDVDFAVFSMDPDLTMSAMKDALKSQNIHAPITKAGFGYQIAIPKDGTGGAKEAGLSHYFDFWLFESSFVAVVDQHPTGTITSTSTSTTGRPRSRSSISSSTIGRNQTKCVGFDKKGCDAFFRNFFLRNAPVYQTSDWFPPRYQVFGTHRVPIPATDKAIEMIPFDEGGVGFWNTTCGPSRRWYPDIRKFVNVKKEERVCSNFYDNHPFVFLKDDGTEQLRQGSTVLHEAPRVK